MNQKQLSIARSNGGSDCLPQDIGVNTGLRPVNTLRLAEVEIVRLVVRSRSNHPRPISRLEKSQGFLLVTCIDSWTGQAVLIRSRKSGCIGKYSKWAALIQARSVKLSMRGAHAVLSYEAV